MTASSFCASLYLVEYLLDPLDQLGKWRFWYRNLRWADEEVSNLIYWGDLGIGISICWHAWGWINLDFELFIWKWLWAIYPFNSAADPNNYSRSNLDNNKNSSLHCQACAPLSYQGLLPPINLSWRWLSMSRFLMILLFAFYDRLIAVLPITRSSPGNPWSW